ncbi:hypothetical protein ACFZAG_18375 [Streptomyces sp. NPDC012403]|uniref:hypothetical protein n=1 Tax=Streptomyces sp. NPDC012403 TaxID=3364831 RepID=UPI0036EE9DBE
MDSPLDLGFWSVDEYRRSREAALRGLGRTATATSRLIASLIAPAAADFVFRRPMYRDGEVVHVRNAVIFLDELDGPFDPQEPWRSVRSRCPVDEDGNRVSEWVTSASRVRRFLECAWGP